MTCRAPRRRWLQTDSMHSAGAPEGGTLRTLRDRSLLLIVDVQTRLAPHVLHHEALLARVDALMQAADLLAIPRRLTEHCPEQIGPVVPALRDGFREEHIFVKTRF